MNNYYNISNRKIEILRIQIIPLISQKASPINK